MSSSLSNNIHTALGLDPRATSGSAWVCSGPRVKPEDGAALVAAGESPYSTAWSRPC